MAVPVVTTEAPLGVVLLVQVVTAVQAPVVVAVVVAPVVQEHLPGMPVVQAARIQ